MLNTNEAANGNALRCHLEQIFSKLQLFNQQWLQEMNVAQRKELGVKAWWAQFEALPMVKLCLVQRDTTNLVLFRLTLHILKREQRVFITRTSLSLAQDIHVKNFIKAGSD